MLRQILIVSCVFAITLLGLRAFGVPMPGPIAISLSCIAAVVCVRAGGEPFAAIGLIRWPPMRTALVAVGCAVLGYIVAAVATVVATRVLGWAPMQSGKIGAIAGNLPMLLGLLAIAWSTAAFGEELLFRGFLLGRLRGLLGDGPGFGIVAAFVQALLFGLAHAYQGPTGILVTGLIGLVFGLLYLRLRVLWPLVIAHGLIDTVGLLALYAGVVPR
ncbi:MAG TPA: CPBP family intramembrane glutamic endopeptidase [Tahibacter sp.]|nr:CPBP family intramembrane glutamic endopeptidase [Tahibacter sp.]